MDYLTQEKYDSLVNELDHLKKVRRKEVADALLYAKSLGDLSENAEYHEARDTQAVVEDRINHIESILKTAKIIDHHTSGVAEVGSTITLKKDGDKDEKVYILVGAEEADIKLGKISVISPIGKALLGQKKGDSVSVKTPSGETKYKIQNIK